MSFIKWVSATIGAIYETGQSAWVKLFTVLRIHNIEIMRDHHGARTPAPIVSWFLCNVVCDNFVELRCRGPRKAGHRCNSDSIACGDDQWHVKASYERFR